MGGSESKAIAAVRRGALEDLELLGEDAAAGVDGDSCTPPRTEAGAEQAHVEDENEDVHGQRDAHKTDHERDEYARPHNWEITTLVLRQEDGADEDEATAGEKEAVVTAAAATHASAKGGGYCKATA